LPKERDAVIAVNNPDDVQPARIARPSRKQRLAALFREYGLIAIITHITIATLVVAGLSLAIGIGVSPSTATGVLGVIAAGWVASQPTLPLRTLITLTLTPVIARVIRRRRTTPPAPSAAVVLAPVQQASDAAQT
jgi:non-ribosomal peptide synthetase component F